MQAGAASAALPGITQTAITSPSDPSYFYDSTGGASGGFTVAGTTNSSDPASDQVDIDCYEDDGSSGTYEYTVYSDVSLNSSGGFSQFVPYSDMEEPYFDLYYGPPTSGSCRLRAVPAGTAPATGLGSYVGPRVLLSYLATEYDSSEGETVPDYILVGAGLGATNVYTSAGDCGLYGAYLNDPDVFGQPDVETFACTDTTAGDWDLGPQLWVDGEQAYMTYQQDEVDYDADVSSVAVSATQDPANGDLVIHETDPIDICAAGTYPSCENPDYSPSFIPSGVELDRTIQQSSEGNVVQITDSFVSTDGAAHSVSVGLENQQCFSTSFCNGDDGPFTPADISYEFPGQTDYNAYSVNGDTVSVPGTVPDSIYVQTTGDTDGSTSGAQGAITYFTAPNGDSANPTGDQFAFDDEGCTSTCWSSNLWIAPYTLSVPAGGSADLSYAYSSEFSSADLSGDIQTAEGLEQTPLSFSSSAQGVGGESLPGTTTTTTYHTTTSTTTTTTAPGPWIAILHPLASTGAAKPVGRHSERLSGALTSGSAAVDYYFAYGTGRHYGHHTQIHKLAASRVSHNVSVTLAGLTAGEKYHYRLVVTGAEGKATGIGRDFEVTADGSR